MFGDKLKELRKKRKISQEDIALKFDVTISTVSAWENNKAQPNYDKLKELAEYFDTSTDYLLGVERNEFETIDKVNNALKEAGMLNGDENMTINDLTNAIQIVNMLKQNKDTK